MIIPFRLSEDGVKSDIALAVIACLAALYRLGSQPVEPGFGKPLGKDVSMPCDQGIEPCH
jgi:hypothetical protein